MRAKHSAMPDNAKASVERLFAEPFEPQWLQAQREPLMAELRESQNKWRKLVVERANKRWQLEAKQSQHRIMAKCRGVWYSGS